MAGSRGKKVAIGVGVALGGIVLAILIGIGSIIGGIVGIVVWYGKTWSDQMAKLNGYYKDGYVYITTPEQFMAVAKNYEVIPNADTEKDIIPGIWTYRDFQESLISTYSGIQGYKLGADIDFTGVDVVCNPLYNAAQNGIDPIEKNEGKYLGFNGVLDGNGYALKNITMDGDFASLFGVLGENAQVSNLKIKNSTFTGGEYVGGFLSYVALDDVGGVLENCTAEDCTIGNETSKYVGGIAGKIISNRNGFVMKNCATRNSNVKGESYVGGVLGWYHASSDCKDKVKILEGLGNYDTRVIGYKRDTSEDSCANVGGVIGCITLDDSATTVKDCFNFGRVTCTNNAGVGGVVGRVYHKSKTALPLYYANKVYFENCTNYGGIDGKEYVGGVCGTVGKDIHTVSFQDCTNYANVLATENCVGGICGEVYYASSDFTAVFEGCSNLVDKDESILGADYVGGICGKNGKFSQCKNTMTIYYTKGDHVGNIAGSPTEALDYCLEEGEVVFSD